MGRFVIITGGSTGIGRQLVQAFAGLGDTVAFSYLGDDAPAKSLVSLMEQQGRNVLALSADVGDGDTVEQFFNQACAWAKASPAVLINNAGVQTWSSLLDLSEKDWNRVIRTNLTGTFLNTKAAASRMVAAGNGGAIVNIGSGCNKLAFPNLVDYTASKGGVEQFTKVAAVELGPHGIRVNCVAPVPLPRNEPMRKRLIMAKSGARSRRCAGWGYRRILPAPCSISPVTRLAS